MKKVKTMLTALGIAALVAGMMVTSLTEYDQQEAYAKQFYPSPATKHVSIVSPQEERFVPDVLIINSGDTVRFMNVDGLSDVPAHLLSVDVKTGIPNGNFESDLLHVGQSYEVTFRDPGIYEYIDSMYSLTKGIILVV